MNDLTKNRANPFDKAYFIKPDTDFDKTDKTYKSAYRFYALLFYFHLNLLKKLFNRSAHSFSIMPPL